MLLTGKIIKHGSAWLAECDVVGAYTEGRSRKDAMAMLADCIATKIDPTKIKISVTAVGEESPGVHVVQIDADNLPLLAAEVLGYQREAHKLTLAEVAKRIGASSLNAYAAYEHGTREPSLSKFRELLGAIAPELALTVGPRAVRAPARPRGRRAARRAS